MLLPPPHIPVRRAFTLVELLVVIGIIALILSLVVPAIVSVNAGGDLTKSTYQVSGALDNARADAMARKAYRYVALESAVVGGNAVIRVKILGYRTGGQFPGDGTVALVPLNPTATLNNLRIACFADDKPPARTAADQKLAVLSPEDPSEKNAFTGTITAAGLDNAFLFELAANGEAHLVEARPDPNNPNGPATYSRALSHWIEIGLQPTRGTVVPTGTGTGNRAVVQIAGLTGQTQVFRP